MKKATKSLVSSALAAITVLSSLLTAPFTVSISANETAEKAPTDIDRVVVDCRSAEAFSKTSKVYVHTPTQSEPDPYTGGKYSFSNIMKAMEVEYNENASADRKFRILTSFNVSGNLTAEYKYFVIVYAAMTESSYRLSLWNGGRAGPELILNSSGKDTKAKFVVSEPVDISGANANGVSTLSRWMGNIHCTINFGSTDERARFFIKEYAFFKSPEDARAYYAAVDLDNDPVEYGENAVKPKSSSQSTASAVPVIIDPSNNVCEVSFNVAEEPKSDILADTSAAAEPVIMSFAGKDALRKNAAIRDFSSDPKIVGIGGEHEYVTLEDGTTCLKLNYSTYAGYYNYRVMPYFTSGGKVTADHKYMCVTFMTTDVIPHVIEVKNNASAKDTVTLIEDTSVSMGKFITTEPCDISSGDILKRFSSATHNTIQCDSLLENTEIYIKEISFFASKAQAYEYYGEQIPKEAKKVEYLELKFGEIGEGVAVRDDATWGNSVDNLADLEILYTEKTNIAGIKYMAKIKTATKAYTNRNYRYMRVLYSADNPDDVKQASMFLRCDLHGGTELVRITDNVVDTEGRFVLSDTVCIFDHHAERFYSGIQNSLFFNTQSEGGTYKIKSVIFFPDRESAEAYTASDAVVRLTIAGNDISNYRIVISKDAPVNVVASANSISKAIENLTYIKIPVVTDETPETEYEILVGQSNRAFSTSGLEGLSEREFTVFVKDSKLVITSALGLTTVTAADNIKKTLFLEGVTNKPKEVVIPADFSIRSEVTSYVKADFWEMGDPVASPTVFAEDFDVNEGYFNEDDGEKNWKYENGTYATSADSYASSYLHVYEKNVTYKATLSYASENGGTMGILARVNSYEAYIKAGYDFDKNEWYIESRDGKDYFLNRVGTAKATVAPNTNYDIVLTLLGDKATLEVDGEVVIDGATVTHVSPGRLGVYAEDVSASVDNIEITLVSGQGTIWPNVYHTRIPGEVYLEGGTVTEMKDGSLIYTHQSNTTYKSLDSGKSWQKTEKWLDSTYSYLNIIRLKNGDLLHIVWKTVDGVRYMSCRTSSDEGKTWVDGGIICELQYKDTDANAGNMNDKIMVTKDGRILYCQAYESRGSKADGRMIFCRYYFSDDNGMTWYKSDTDSWNIPGLENEEYFGENKLLECADGTIRMYASWHMLGYVVYSESTDGGKTFGPLQYLYNMHTPTSSMQFVKDEYADNDYTYYMVWVNAEPKTTNTHTPRSRLSLAKTTDGKNWVYLGDVMRWESTYMMGTTIINHIVDPFIKTTEDYIICGTGFSEGTKEENESGSAAHMGQRQNIFTIKKDTLPEGIKMNRFTDVPYGADYYEAVTFVSDEELFQGTSETTFSPNSAMNRAMFVTVLGRLAKADVSNYTTPTFSDVVAGQWYTSYVEWAAANGIVNGLGNDIYGINENVTVQQACVILARYANYAAAASDSGKNIADYSDGTLVADWAVKEVEWALANGIYDGIGGNINPNAPASRAMVAEMICNYVKAFGN